MSVKMRITWNNGEEEVVEPPFNTSELKEIKDVLKGGFDMSVKLNWSCDECLIYNLNQARKVEFF
jgi:hypothetical protein